VTGGAWLAVTAAPARAGTTGAEKFAGRAAASGVADHGAFDVLLAKFARSSRDGVVRVDYAGWKRSSGDISKLRRYIDDLAAQDPLGLSRAEQFAFWANLYNALTLQVVLDAYPVASIREVRPTLLALGPWKKSIVRVAGIDLSLDAIEQEILRKGWRDPRVHYAVNCASISCPNLPLQAWRGAGLSTALNAAARAYVSHPRGASFEGNALVVSSIYRWYAADFGGADPGIIAHLAGYAADGLRARLQATRRISRDQYDWSLNATGMSS
jgi:hypothetical protein